LIIGKAWRYVRILFLVSTTIEISFHQVLPVSAKAVHSARQKFRQIFADCDVTASFRRVWRCRRLLGQLGSFCQFRGWLGFSGRLAGLNRTLSCQPSGGTHYIGPS
jgi:hypothetical protein